MVINLKNYHSLMELLKTIITRINKPPPYEAKVDYMSQRNEGSDYIDPWFTLTESLFSFFKSLFSSIQTLFLPPLIS